MNTDLTSPRVALRPGILTGRAVTDWAPAAKMPAATTLAVTS